MPLEPRRPNPRRCRHWQSRRSLCRIEQVVTGEAGFIEIQCSGRHNKTPPACYTENALPWEAPGCLPLAHPSHAGSVLERNASILKIVRQFGWKQLGRIKSHRGMMTANRMLTGRLLFIRRLDAGRKPASFSSVNIPCSARSSAPKLSELGGSSSSAPDAAGLHVELGTAGGVGEPHGHARVKRRGRLEQVLHGLLPISPYDLAPLEAGAGSASGFASRCRPVQPSSRTERTRVQRGGANLKRTGERCSGPCGGRLLTIRPVGSDSLHSPTP
jgi:hypothetical protein